MWQKKWFRRLVITLVTLFLLYTIIGFFGPALVIRYWLLPNANEQVAGTFEIESIHTNPFTWRMQLLGLEGKTPDGSTAFSMAEFRGQVQPFSFLSDEYVIKEVFLGQPSLNLIIDEEGNINIQSSLERMQDQIAQDAAERAAEENPEPFVIPRAHIVSLEVRDASLSCEIKSLAKPFKREISRVSFIMKDLRTGPEFDNPYDFNLETPLGEKLKITGSLKLDPLSSRGHVVLDQLEVEDFQAFAGDAIQIDIKGGIVNFSGDYSFEPLATDPELALTETNLSLEGLDMFGSGQDTPFQSIKKVAIEGLDAFLLKDRIHVDKITIEESSLTVIRDEEGVLNLIRYTSPPERQADIATAAQAEKAEGSTGTREIRLGVQAGDQDVGVALDSAWSQIQELVTVNWDLTVDELTLTEQAVTWRDEFLDRPAELRLANINLEVTDLNNRATTPIPFTLGMSVNESGSVKLNGGFIPEPASSTFSFDVANMPLTAVSPYGDAFSPVRLTEGSVSAKGDGSIEFGDTTLPELSVQCSVNVNALKVVWHKTETPFIAWQDVNIEGINASSVPLSLKVQTLSIDQPQLWVERLEDGSIKLPLPETAGKTDADKPVAESAPKDDAAAPAIDTSDITMEIATLKATGGTVHIKDVSVQPHTEFSVGSIDASISPLSLDTTTSSDIDVALALADGPKGKVKVKGNALLWQPLDTTKVKVTTEAVTLPAFAAYAVPMVGQPPISGAMSAQLDYALDKGKLKGKNKVRIQDMRFGPRVKGSDAPKLPLELGIAILEDRNGVMHIDIPVEGDTNDPKFSLGQVISYAIGNVITKLVTAPFSALGSVFAGEDGPPAKHIEFEPGKANLSEKSAATLIKISEVLFNRPALALELTASIDPKADMAALQEAQLKSQIEAKVAEGMSEEAAINELWQATSPTVDPEGGEVSMDAKRAAALAAIVVPDVELTRLAEKRALNAQAEILGDGSVSPERVIIKKTEDGNAFAKDGPKVLFGVEVSPQTGGI